MYTSDTDKSKSRAAKTALVYLMFSIFCALFGAIYEVYSHEVYSFYMIYAFAFPLVGGALPFLLFHVIDLKYYPGIVTRNLYHYGIATFTVGSIVQGIVDIYGTINSLIMCYWEAGAFLIILSILIFMFRGNSDK